MVSCSFFQQLFFFATNGKLLNNFSLNKFQYFHTSVKLLSELILPWLKNYKFVPCVGTSNFLENIGSHTH